MQRLFTLRVCLLIVGVLCGSVYFYCADPHRFPLRTIKITANLTNLKAEDIQNIVEKYVDANYFFSRTNQMKDALHKHVWVDQVAVSRIWPDAIKITIVEKIPIAWWNENLITKEGEIVPPVAAGKYPLPHLMGPANQKEDVLQIYQNVSKILSEYDLSVTDFIWKNNQALDLVLTNGIQLNLGKQAIETRITRFCRAYSTVFAEKKAQLARVDLRYPRGMAVQWSK